MREKILKVKDFVGQGKNNALTEALKDFMKLNKKIKDFRISNIVQELILNFFI